MMAMLLLMGVLVRESIMARCAVLASHVATAAAAAMFFYPAADAAGAGW
jgi:hypothetical protein